MAKINKQEQLRNKFLDVEMSLIDSEIKYTLPKENIEKIKKTRNNDVPVLFVYAGFLLRTSQIIFSYLGRGFYFLWKEIVKPVVKEIQKTLVYTFKKLSYLREQGEISLDGYLSKVENDLVVEQENTKTIDQKRDVGIESYENELIKLFEGINTTAKLSCEKNEFEKVNLSLEFDVSLYELMSHKLKSSKLITNVSCLKIVSVVDEKNVTNTIEFDLKVSGEKWSVLFSKHLASEFMNRIESYRGKVKNLHVANPILKSEKFVFVFTHHRLDLFMDKAIEETVPEKVVVLDNFVQLDI